MIIIATLFLLVGDWPGASVGTGDGWPDNSDPMTAWAWPEMGYLIETDEDQRLHDAGIAAFRASWEQARSQFSQRIISVIAGRLFVMPSTYRRLFASREYHCPSCWDFQPFERGSQEGLHAVAELSIRAAGGDPEAYDTLLVLTDFDDGHTWDDFRPLRPLSELIREGYFHTGDWYAAQKEGTGLYEIPIWKVDIVYPESLPMKQEIPDWVFARIGTYKPWVDAAMASLQGLTPAEFMQKHKYFPMDRTPRDMQYGKLRYKMPSTPHYVDIDDPTISYYSKFWEERIRVIVETRLYNEGLDKIFGVEVDRAPVNDILARELDGAAEMRSWKSIDDVIESITNQGDGQAPTSAHTTTEPLYLIEPNQYCPIPLFAVPLGGDKYFTWESMGPGMKQITEYDPRRYDD